MSDAALRNDAAEALKEHGIALLIDAIATKSAKEAVSETFFLLGVNLKDPDHVRSTRDVITRMRDRFQLEQRRKDRWGNGVVHGLMTVAAGTVLAMGTYVATGHWLPPWRQ